MTWWLIQNTLTAALLAAVVVLICRWRAAQPALRHALWLVVLVKLIAPPLPVWSFAWPGSLNGWWRSETLAQQSQPMDDINAAEPEQSAPSMATIVPTHDLPEPSLPGDPESYEVLDASEVEPFVPAPSAPRVTQAAVTPLAVTSATWSMPPWMQSLSWRDAERYAVWAWLTSVAVTATYQLYRWRRFQQLLDATSFAPDWLDEEVQGIAAELGITAPQVLVMEQRCTPLVWVLGPARLLWPEAMLTGFSRESRRTIIAHELAHLARRDHWVARLEAVATVFWWWHPLFWYARAKLHDAAEQACDARVTQLLPGARKAYAQALIEVCELLSTAVTPGPALGIGSQTRRAFERRLTMIMREQVSSRLSLGAVLGVGILALAVLPGFTPAQVAPPAAEAPVAPAAVNPPLPAPADPTTGVPLLPEPTPAPSAANPFVAPPAPNSAPLAPSAADPAAMPPVTQPPVAPYVEPFTGPAVPGAPGTDPNMMLPSTGAPSAMSGGYAAPTMGPPSAMPVATPHPWSSMMGAMPKAEPVSDESGAEEVIHLTRATYRLPYPLAQQFAQFLNGTLGHSVQATAQEIVRPVQPNPGAPVLAESTGRIIVTADVDTQKVVGHFIGLLREQGRFEAVPPTPSMRSASYEVYAPTASYDEPKMPTPSASETYDDGGTKFYDKSLPSQDEPAAKEVYR